MERDTPHCNSTRVKKGQHERQNQKNHTVIGHAHHRVPPLYSLAWYPSALEKAAPPPRERPDRPSGAPVSPLGPRKKIAGPSWT